MRLDHLHEHHSLMSRRDAPKLGAGAVAAAAAATSGLGILGSQAGAAVVPNGEGNPRPDLWNDEMFDVEAVLAGAWAPGPYGAGDQRGSLNNVTPEKTASALARLDTAKPVHSFQLGESMFNGFPAFPSTPPRGHEMQLYVLGYDAGPDFDGIQSATTPLGPNQLTGHEERFKENYTFQIATQIDGLNHVGVGDMYYNGFRASEFVTGSGTKVLGNETMGPIVTRGVILDVVGLKVAQGHSDDFFVAANGKPVLRDNYRITIQDMNHCMNRQGISQDIGAGDVVILHTGWTHLVRTDASRYLAQEPGIYLAEARYLASKRVALAATDTWGLEVLDPEVTSGNAFPCHQELFGKHGIRIGESFVTDAAIERHVYDGVFIATPQNVPGATCGSAPPALLGQPGPAPR